MLCSLKKFTTAQPDTYPEDFSTRQSVGLRDFLPYTDENHYGMILGYIFKTHNFESIS